MDGPEQSLEGLGSVGVKLASLPRKADAIKTDRTDAGTPTQTNRAAGPVVVWNFFHVFLQIIL